MRLTDLAYQKVVDMLQPGEVLRVGVQGGGCSGLMYTLGFDKQDEGDVVQQQGKVTIVTDPRTYKLIKNISIDFSRDLIAGGFKFHNPDAARSCGCGISFSGDE